MLQSIANAFQALPDWLQYGGQFVIGVVFLVAGGNWLVHGSVTIARRLGVPVLLIGLTIVAAGTSAPELAFNLFAVLDHRGEMCFGNIIGSNIANICLVLGLCAVARPLVVDSVIVRRELPWLVGISLLMFIMALLPTSRQDTGESTRGFGFIDGGLFLLGFVFVLFVWYRQAVRDVRDPLIDEVTQSAESEALRSMWLAWVALGLGLAALWFGGHFTRDGAVGIARIMGLSEFLIGMTIVAVATSLPEIVTSLIAVRRGHADLAVGNVAGSNLFNILFVLGITTVVGPVGVPAIWGWYDLFFMLLVTAALFPLAYFSPKRNLITRSAGGLLLAFYILYMTFAVIREHFGWADDIQRLLNRLALG